MGIALSIRETPAATSAHDRLSPVIALRSYAHSSPAPAEADRLTAELGRIGAQVLCRKGQTLVQEGDPAGHVFLVVSGGLRLVRLLADGRRHVASFLLPGEYVGLADRQSYNFDIEALADTTLLRIARQSFERFLDRESSARNYFLGLICRELSAVHDHLLLLGRKTAEERLASFLLTMVEHGNRHAGNARRKIVLPMNRSDVADYLGLRIETVCRLLSDLRKRGLVDIPDIHSVVLLQPDALEAIGTADMEWPAPMARRRTEATLAAY